MVEKYVIDFDAINQYLFSKDNLETQSDIVEMYQQGNNGLELVNKQYSEAKNVQNDSNITIKYDLLKMLFGEVLGVEDFSLISDGNEFALNSLLAKGFIKIISKED